MKKVILCLGLMLGFAPAFSEERAKDFLVFFAKDAFFLDPIATSQLNEVVQFLKDHPDASVELLGRTDFDGDHKYNLSLSQRRTLEVADFLSKTSGLQLNLTRRWYGEIRPLSHIADESGKALNRSVQILIRYAYFANTEAWLMENRTRAAVHFTLSGKGVNTLSTINGTLLHIPEDAFVDLNGNPVENPKVSLLVEEVHSPWDALIHNTFTQSGDRLLETGGMLNITATSGNKELKLAPGKEITIEIPTSSMDADMLVFEGVMQKGGVIDWKNTGAPFRPVNNTKRTSLSLSSEILLKLIRSSSGSQPAFARHNIQLRLPVPVNSPARPTRPTLPVKPEAKSLYHPFWYLFTTEGIRKKAVDKAYKRNLELYHQKMARYEKQSIRYEAAMLQHKNKLDQFEAEKTRFYNELKTVYAALIEEYNAWQLYYDKKRVQTGLNRLYHKNKQQELYDKNPVVSLKKIACEHRMTPEEELVFNYLTGAQNVVATLLCLPYDQIYKKHNHKGVLSIARLKGRHLVNHFAPYLIGTRPNNYLDSFMVSHKLEFEELFGANFKQHLRLIEHKQKAKEGAQANTVFTGSSRNLGWINCDRFATQPLVRVNAEIVPGACQMVVISNMRSYLQTAEDPMQAVNYARLPENRAFKLITLKVEGDFAYLSVEEAKANHNLMIKPQLKKMPLKQANDLIASL